MEDFNLTKNERRELFQFTIDRLEAYYQNTKSHKLSPPLIVDEIVSKVKNNGFDRTTDPRQAISDVIHGLEKFSIHTSHPKYLGLFVPRVNFPSIISDFITAVFNPQLAAWSHAPYAIEIENYLVLELGKKFGYTPDKIEGVFTTGGSEANLTAILCALNHSFSNFSKDGLFGLSKRPMIYCSLEAHHSIDKAAKILGLGRGSLRKIRVNSNLQIDIDELKLAIQHDIHEGKQPFIIIGTAGTTGVGSIDDLVSLRTLADDFNLWFHVDAAYGGGAILDKQLKPFFKGIEQSDSITFDAHKWMSLSACVGVFLTSHKTILKKTFNTITASYMPSDTKNLDVVNPYLQSIQWTRRFIGLRLYLSLRIFGWKGYEEIIAYQTKIGEYLKEQLLNHGWTIENNTPLPIICFTDSEFQNDEIFAQSICQSLIKSGKSWISVYPVNGVLSLRACVTNYDTTQEDIDEFIEEINTERERYK